MGADAEAYAKVDEWFRHTGEPWQFIQAYKHYDDNCCYGTGARLGVDRIEGEMDRAQSTVFDLRPGGNVGSSDRARLEMLAKTFGQVFGSQNIREDAKVNGGDMSDRAFFDHIRRDVAPALSDLVRSLEPPARTPGEKK